MAEKFSTQGFAFYALDLRKYGRSHLENQKIGNVRNLNEYFADIDTALSIMHQEGVDKILLSGHSTGGLIVSLYANQRIGKELFDEKIIMMMDCDMYVRLHDKYGEPHIINDLLICNRTHNKQMQHFYQHIVDDEVKYCLNKYKGE